MKVLGRMLLFLICVCVFCGAVAGVAEQGDADMAYRTEEIWCDNGDSDGTVDVSWSEHAAEIIPNCEFHVIPGGGHEFYGQPFEDAIGHILSYIDQLNVAD